MDWNVLLTLQPGPRPPHETLGALGRFGHFRFSAFRDVCVGLADDPAALLEGVSQARVAGKPWAQRIGRLIPVETMFTVTAEDLAQRLKEAIAPYAERLQEGASFCVRLHLRGLADGRSASELERELGEHLQSLATQRGRSLSVDLEHPDFLIAVETLGSECGVALLDKALRQRLPVVHA